jgi:hypothetical protein
LGRRLLRLIRRRTSGSSRGGLPAPLGADFRLL